MPSAAAFGRKLAMGEAARSALEPSLRGVQGRNK